MKSVAQIGVSILGIYLLTNALSVQAGSFWSISSSAGLRGYVMVFGPSFILLFGGIICLVFRDSISSWIIKGQKTTDLPAEINLQRIECIVLSLIGIMVLLEIVPYFAMTVNHLFVTSDIQITESAAVPIKSYAFVQTVAVAIDFCLASVLIFFPHKVQTILNKTRSF